MSPDLLTALAPNRRQPVDHRSPPTPCRSPTPTSFARPAPRSEKSPRRRSTPSRPARRRSSTSARRPSGSRATCPAPRTSPRATSSSRSRRAAPDRDAPVDPLLRRRRPLAVRRPDPRRDGLHGRRLDVRRLPGLEGRRASTFETPVVLIGRAEAALQPPPADPRGRRRPARRGCSARRRSSSAPAASARRPRSTSPRRASGRSASSTSTSSTSATSSARSSTRPTGSGSARSNRAKRSINALNPEIKVVAHEEMLVAANVERIIAGYDVILDGTDTFETRYILNDAAVAAGIPVVHACVFRFEGQLTTFVPYEGPCYRCLYPTPPPPELAPGCSVAGVLGVVPGHPRPAPGQRGAQGPARDRQHAGRPAAPVRCPRDRVHRAQAAPRPELPGLLGRGRRGARGRPPARPSTASATTRRSS